MIEDIVIPEILKQEIGNEEIMFLVKAKKEQPIRNCISVMGFGLFWILVISLIFSAFDVSSLNTFYIYHFVFILPGLICLILGFFGLFKSGGYFVGTHKRMICYRWGKVESHFWDNFSYKIISFGNQKHGNLIFELKTGVTIVRKYGTVFSPTKINVGDIIYASQIKIFCRERILENNSSSVTGNLSE